MILFWERTTQEQIIVRKAYEFEVFCIEQDSPLTTKNPYREAILQMQEGNIVWEAINIALEMKYE